MQLQRSGEVTLAWFCLVYTRACELLTLVQSGGPLASFSHVFTNMFDRRRADMFGHVCLFGSGGPLACLVMFKQTC